MATPGEEMVRRLSAPSVDVHHARRRPVRLASLEDLRREVERIAEAARASAGRCDGAFRVTGNWSAGQAIEHVARTIERSMDGFRSPPSWEAPAAKGLGRILGSGDRRRVTAAVEWARARLLALEQDPGGPSIGGPGELEPPALAWTDEALGVLGHVLDRLKAGVRMERPSPTIGPLTHDEWTGFHLRHAELHFSFILIPAGGTGG